MARDPTDHAAIRCAFRPEVPSLPWVLADELIRYALRLRDAVDPRGTKGM